MVFSKRVSINSTFVAGHAACRKGNGGCSHFCLPRIDGERTCNCEYNIKLLSDNKTCNGKHFQKA